MTLTTRHHKSTPSPAARRPRLRPDPLAVLIRRAIQASRVHKELRQPEAEAAYLDLARRLLDLRLDGIRQEMGR